MIRNTLRRVTTRLSRRKNRTSRNDINSLSKVIEVAALLSIFIDQLYDLRKLSLDQFLANAKDFFRSEWAALKIYAVSSHSQRVALNHEREKLKNKKVIEELHKALGIDMYDNSNDMTFGEPYCYPADNEDGNPKP